MAKGPTNRNIPGYQFLCDILGKIHQPSQMKNTLLLRSQGEEPMNKEETRAIQSEFTELIRGVKEARPDLRRTLNRFMLDQYYNAQTGIDSEAFFSGFNNLDSMYTGLFCQQSGTTNLSGIAMTIVLAAGYSQNPDFYVGSYEVREILSKCMECLGYLNTDFIPDSCFELREDGCLDIHTSQLLLLSLYGALKTKYPHKITEDAQRMKNLQKARETIDSLLNSDHNVPIFLALRTSSEMTRICDGMQEALRESTERVRFPNDRELPLTGFYSIPTFETIGPSVTEILRRDYNSSVRSMVIGGLGSGKSLLVNAVARTCMEPAELRKGAIRAFAETLGLQNNHYFPLILNCRKLLPNTDIRQMDLIEEGVRQLMKLTSASRHHECLAHWNDFAPRIVAHFKQRAKNSKLILIVEDLSCLDRSGCDILLQKLQYMEREEYPRLHILIVTQRLLNSQMARFQHYNRVEIAPLTGSLETEIRKLVSLGVGSADSEYYLQLMESNRHVRAFVDSPRHLVKLLCHCADDIFDLNQLLQSTIEEQLEQESGSEVTEDDCREFLTALAVSVAESKKRTGFSRSIHPLEYYAIPKNVVDRGCIQRVNERILQPGAVWQHVMDHMILVCPANAIGSYAFINHNVYCSLVADHYISLMGLRPYTNWLDRFNRVSAEDFSVIIVLMLQRLCMESAGDLTGPAEISPYDMLLLIQSTAGYILSRTEPADIYSCLLALMDVLSNNQIRRSFSYSNRENLWDTLVHVYDHCCRCYRNLSDDPVKCSRLTPPEQFRGDHR